MKRPINLETIYDAEGCAICGKPVIPNTRCRPVHCEECGDFYDITTQVAGDVCKYVIPRSDRAALERALQVPLAATVRKAVEVRLRKLTKEGK